MLESDFAVFKKSQTIARNNLLFSRNAVLPAETRVAMKTPPEKIKAAGPTAA